MIKEDEEEEIRMAFYRLHTSVYIQIILFSFEKKKKKKLKVVKSKNNRMKLRHFEKNKRTNETNERRKENK